MLEDVLHDQTHMNGGDWGSTNNLARFGLATDSWQGLDPNRTLIFVDARRMVRTGAEGFIDLNSNPLEMIESIEVLHDGAAKIYESDAIAGVINVITRDTIAGPNVDAVRRASEVDELNAATGNLGARTNTLIYFEWQTAF